MADDISSQLISKLKSCLHDMFSIQLDKSTDISNVSHLMGFVQWTSITSIEEAILFCSLQSTTQAADILQKVDDYFKSMFCLYGWSPCNDWCTIRFCEKGERTCFWCNISPLHDIPPNSGKSNSPFRCTISIKYCYQNGKLCEKECIKHKDKNLQLTLMILLL